MAPATLLAFMRQHQYAVQASVNPSMAPQAAVIGVAVTDRFEIVFDALDGSRKVQNLRHNPRVALVVGGLAPGDERTVQYEGVADEPWGDDLERLKELYFARFPDGRARQAWPGLVYVRIRPTWIRYSDYSVSPAQIAEFEPGTLQVR